MSEIDGANVGGASQESTKGKGKKGVAAAEEKEEEKDEDEEETKKKNEDENAKVEEEQVTLESEEIGKFNFKNTLLWWIPLSLPLKSKWL